MNLDYHSTRRPSDYYHYYHGYHYSSTTIAIKSTIIIIIVTVVMRSCAAQDVLAQGPWAWSWLWLSGRRSRCLRRGLRGLSTSHKLGTPFQESLKDHSILGSVLEKLPFGGSDPK